MTTNPTNDDITLHNYQDDLDADDQAVDPIMDEASDDPTKDLQIPPAEFKRELDDLVVENNNSPDGHEDARERVEDLDEDDGDTTKY